MFCVLTAVVVCILSYLKCFQKVLPMAIYYTHSMRMWKIDGPRVGAPFFMRTTMHSNLDSIWWDADLLHKSSNLFTWFNSTKPKLCPGTRETSTVGTTNARSVSGHKKNINAFHYIDMNYDTRIDHRCTKRGKIDLSPHTGHILRRKTIIN